MAKHPFIHLRHPEQGRVEIDEEIAPIISHLWDEGIDTGLSCQGDARQEAFIIFPSSDDACRFLDRYESILCDPDWFRHEDLWVFPIEGNRVRMNGHWKIQIKLEWPHELLPEMVRFATSCRHCDCICHVPLGKPGVIHDHLIDSCEHCNA